MITEVVLSPVKDEKMNSHINESEVWKKAYKPEEVTAEVKYQFPAWYEYHVRFNGLVPVQCTKMKEI